MTIRPTNGRIRGNHSFRRAFAVGAVIAAFAIVIFVVLGGGRP